MSRQRWTDIHVKAHAHCYTHTQTPVWCTNCYANQGMLDNDDEVFWKSHFITGRAFSRIVLVQRDKHHLQSVSEFFLVGFNHSLVVSCQVQPSLIIGPRRQQRIVQSTLSFSLALMQSCISERKYSLTVCECECVFLSLLDSQHVVVFKNSVCLPPSLLDVLHRQNLLHFCTFLCNRESRYPTGGTTP